jgi:hypothetical protein
MGVSWQLTANWVAKLDLGTGYRVAVTLDQDVLLLAGKLADGRRVRYDGGYDHTEPA